MKQKPSSRRRRSSTKSVLRLPDLEHAKAAVLNSLNLADAKRGYRHAIDEFVDWYCSEPRLAFNRIVVLRLSLSSRIPSTRPRNHQSASWRRAPARMRSGRLWSSQRRFGCRCPSRQRCEETGHAPRKLVNGTARPRALASPDRQRLKGKRDRALLTLVLACGLRRHEAVALRLDHLQQREEHWAIVDLAGKGDWLVAAAIDRGKLFRRVNKVGRAWGDGMTVKAVRHIVKESAKSIGVAKLTAHDLRRTCARLCHASGGELEQIQFLLGHVSVQTTERYLGCKQRIRSAVNDRIGIEPNP